MATDNPPGRNARELRDLIIAASNGWIIGLDNLSSIPPALSDGLCRLATGGAFATRKLYTDRGESIFKAQRPIILNGIEELATRADLLNLNHFQKRSLPHRTLRVLPPPAGEATEGAPYSGSRSCLSLDRTLVLYLPAIAPGQGQQIPTRSGEIVLS